MTDQPLNDMLHQAARAYHDPPAAPREEMWDKIDAQRRLRRGRRSGMTAIRWSWLGLGAAAILALGVGLGRISVPSEGPPQASQPAPFASSADPRLAFQIAAGEHLSRAEALLTLFRAESGGSGSYDEFSGWAQDLLSTTRLYLDSPIGQDARLRRLLLDLEFVLVQIALLRHPEGPGDVGFITEGIDENAVLMRLRAAIPVDLIRRGDEGVS